MTMKNFTKKIFLLSIGMILSTGVYAQTQTIAHRFPAVRFLYGDRTYTVPAWDVMFGSGDDQSFTHVQAKEPYQYNQNQKVKSKIVSRFGITDDEDFFTSFGGSASAKIKIVKVDENGNTVYDDDGNVVYVANGEDAQGNPVYDFTVNSVTYQQALPNHTFNSTGDAGRKLFNYTPVFEENEYTITTEKAYNGVTFEIEEIGAWAYRGQKGSSGTYATIAAKKVIIPAVITKIGKGAFSFIPSEEIEFADGSTITSLSPAIFMNSDLKKITLPASIAEIRGAALGGLKNLNNIVFKGSVVPELKTDKFEEEVYTCDPFSHIPRFSTSDVTPAKCIIEVPLGSVNAYVASNNGYYATKQFPFCSKFPITTSSGVMTYCSEADFTFKKYNTETTGWDEGDVKVYYVNESDVEIDKSRVVLTEVTGDVMVSGWLSETEDFGVVLKGTSGETYDIFYPNGRITNKLTMADTYNCLHGCVTSTAIDVTGNDQSSFFILSNGTFRRIMTDGSCKANRAYIRVDDGGYDIDVPIESQALALSFPGEDPTGITTHETQGVQNDAYYTLQGIQVKQPQKGIVIKNGKKFVIK